jgi:hypothetical protein
MELVAVNCKSLADELAQPDFASNPTFRFYINTHARTLARLRYRKFHELNSDGVRNEDRIRLIASKAYSTTHKDEFSLMFENKSFHEFLDFYGYGIVAQIHSFRYSEKSLDELGLKKGQKEKIGDDYRFVRFFREDKRIGRFRMKSASRVVGKKLLLEPTK